MKPSFILKGALPFPKAKIYHHCAPSKIRKSSLFFVQSSQVTVQICCSVQKFNHY